MINACVGKRMKTTNVFSNFFVSFYLMVVKKSFIYCKIRIISSDRGGDATCNFNGDTPNDDNAKVDCGQLSTASINGVTFSAPNGSTGSSSSSSTSNAGESNNTTQATSSSTSSGPGMGSTTATENSNNTSETFTSSTSSGPGMDSNNVGGDSSTATSSTNSGPGKQKGGRGRLRHLR